MCISKTRTVSSSRCSELDDVLDGMVAQECWVGHRALLLLLTGGGGGGGGERGKGGGFHRVLCTGFNGVWTICPYQRGVFYWEHSSNLFRGNMASVQPRLMKHFDILGFCRISVSSEAMRR